MPAAAALASAPACRRRSAFSRSPSCTCAMSGVSPENGSLRSSAAAPVPVTRRRSKQSCMDHTTQVEQGTTPVYRHTSSIHLSPSPSLTRTRAAHAPHQAQIISSSPALDLSVAVRQRMLAHEAGEAALAHAALALVLGAGGDGGEVGMLVKLAPQLRFIHAAEREQNMLQRVRTRSCLRLGVMLMRTENERERKRETKGRRGLKSVEFT